MSIRRWTTRSLLTATLLVAACAQAATPKNGIEEWVGRLGDSRWKVRQEATEHLVGYGEDALPRLLQLVATSDNGEMRSRASTIIGEIMENRVTGMSRITLKMEQAPAAQGFAEVARQAHAALLTDPPNLLSQKNMKPVSLDVDHRPFWEVMESLCAQTGLEMTGISRHSREIGLGLIRGNPDWADKPTVFSGPLMIRANSLVRVSTAHLKKPVNLTEEFNISLEAFAEPKLRVLDYSSVLKLLEVVDEKGNSLIPPPDRNAPANVDVFGNSREGYTSHWEIGASLHHPKGCGKKIAKFRASTTLLVQTASAALELPLTGSNEVTRNVGPLRVTVAHLDSNRCELTVYRDGRDDADWYQVRMQLNASEAKLLDDKDRVVGRSVSSMDADESPDSQRMVLRLRFAREGVEEGKDRQKRSASEVTKLVWTLPTQTRELTVGFEFRDLPIP
jgi:hypothetical protein